MEMALFGLPKSRHSGSADTSDYTMSSYFSDDEKDDSNCVLCPHCGRNTNISSRADGVKVRCEKCHKQFTIPSGDSTNKQWGVESGRREISRTNQGRAKATERKTSGLLNAPKQMAKLLVLCFLIWLGYEAVLYVASGIDYSIDAWRNNYSRNSGESDNPEAQIQFPTHIAENIRHLLYMDYMDKQTLALRAMEYDPIAFMNASDGPNFWKNAKMIRSEMIGETSESRTFNVEYSGNIGNARHRRIVRATLELTFGDWKLD